MHDTQPPLPTDFHRVIRELLGERGIANREKIFDFFYQDLYSLSSPFYIKDIYTFIARIKEAIDGHEYILIYGDKDADGVSAAAIAYITLSKLTEKVQAYVPDLAAGYGLNKEILDDYIKSGVTLVITCDCGISNVTEITYLREQGIDVLVTDHHDIPETLPPAYALFNPKLPDSGFATRDLCGAGVIFKLMQGLVFSYSEFYNSDFLIFDFKHTDTSYTELEYIRILRLRNFVPYMENIFEAERTETGEYTIQGEASLRLPLIDVLDEIGSFAFENEESYFVATGGKERLDTLFKTFAHHEVEPPPALNTYDLFALGRKTFAIADEDAKTLEGFALRAGVNIYRYQDSPHAKLRILAECFNAVFIRSRGSMLAYYESILPLVALATVADVVPLLRENRALVKSGLRAIETGKHTGIRMLLQNGNGKTPAINTRTIAWRIAPAINAAGRMGETEKAFQLLSAKDEATATALSETVQTLNNERKKLTEENLRLAEELLAQNASILDEPVIIIKSNRFEQGLTGLVAGRLVSRYEKAAVVICEDAEKGEYVGSARSKGADNVRKMIEHASEMVLKFGGHTNASGFSLLPEHFEAFHAKCIEAAKDLRFGEAVLEKKYDMLLSFPEIDLPLAEQIEQLAPFGEGNTEPLFATNNVEIVDMKTMGENKNHLDLRLREGNATLRALSFRRSEREIESFEYAHFLDIVYRIRVDRFHGRATPALHLETHHFHE